MGRDTTAHKRMAAKRSREKAAGLRRLNVAVQPEVFDRLAVLMKHYNCASQARLIELLVLDSSIRSPSPELPGKRNEVTSRERTTKRQTPTKKQQPNNRKQALAAKAAKVKTRRVAVQKESSPTQMSLFET